MKMKAALWTLCLFVAALSLPAAAETTLNYQFDSGELSDAIYSNTEVRLDTEAIDYFTVKSGSEEVFMLPLRAVLTDFADVRWDAATRSVYTTAGDQSVVIKISDSSYQRGAETKKMAVAPQIKNNRTYVPLSFFEDAFGFWFANKEEGVVDLFMPNAAIENI